MISHRAALATAGAAGRGLARFVTVGVSLALACGSVSVSPPRSGFRAEPRRLDCSLEFVRAVPDRPYDELGELYSYYPGVVDAHDALREKACELGADAVIVTRDFVISTARTPDRKLVAGTAIKYREPAAPPDHRG